MKSQFCCIFFLGNIIFQKLKLEEQLNITNINKVLVKEINKIRVVDLMYNAVSIDKNATIANLILKNTGGKLYKQIIIYIFLILYVYF